MQFEANQLTVIRDLCIEKGLVMVSIVEEINKELGIEPKEEPIPKVTETRVIDPLEWLSPKNRAYIENYAKIKEKTIPEALEALIDALRYCSEIEKRGQKKVVKF
jgi:hypothetical protein